jgi:hypothetical protein
MRWILGLDLGQVSDYSALVALEQSERADTRHYAVRHLERFALGTPYPAVSASVQHLVSRLPLTASCLVVDQTGVGRAVVDLLRQSLAGQVRPITITAGHAVHWDGSSTHVPKRELVGAVQVLLQTRRLQISAKLRLAEVLKTEMQNFRVRIVASAKEVFGADRAGQHDDLMLALALAAWVGETIPEPYTGPVVYNPIPEDYDEDDEYRWWEQ